MTKIRASKSATVLADFYCDTEAEANRLALGIDNLVREKFQQAYDEIQSKVAEEDWSTVIDDVFAERGVETIDG